MSQHPQPESATVPEAASLSSDTQWLVGGLLVAFVLFYVVGVDQGAVSILGADAHLHEWVHDARHFLGFPCH